METAHTKRAFGLNELALQSGLSVAFLRKQAKSGALKTKKFGARRLVLSEDWENYLKGEN